MSDDRIETMRTFFVAHGHEVDPVIFAAAQLRIVKRAVTKQMQDLGFAPVTKLALLESALGDPTDPIDAPVDAYVNRGRWIAECECGGAEIVDPITRLFMCASCFNLDHKHRWRLVALPDATTSQVIEAALVMRPELRTRNWRPGESVADLIAQNVENGLMQVGNEIRIEGTPPIVEEVV